MPQSESMTTFLTSELDSTERYKLTTGLIVPRPIGWIGTIDEDGNQNLAPYSFFNAVATNPPVVFYSVGVANGVEKDSLRNARTSGEFTTNLVDMDRIEAMNTSAAELPAGESEFDLAGLTTLASDEISAPRVAEARASLECKVVKFVDFGEGSVRHVLVFGEVIRFHIAEALLDGTRVDLDGLRAVGRMGGPTYASTSDQFHVNRPK